MGEKVLSGTYSSGYTLSSSFSVLYVTASGVVHGVDAPAYVAGGDGVTVGFVAEVLNHGSLTGGSGGKGVPVSGKSEGGSGNSGGAGANLTAGGTLSNYLSVVGGMGGQGGSGYGGGVGGSGGYGVRVGATGTVTNASVIAGGQGGFGGSGTFGGHGGAGGAGIGLAGGSVNNGGIVLGGYGGNAIPNPHHPGAGGEGGSAVELSAPGSVVNSGLLEGGGGGVSAASNYAPGLYGAVGGAGVSLGVGGLITNGGNVVGGVGGAGGGGGVGYYNGGNIYYFGGQGGTGGAGCVLAAGGTVINTGTIAGGAGGAGGQGGKSGYVGAQGAYGDGVYLANGGVVTNGSTTATSAVITGLFGVYDGAGGAATVTNFGTIGGYGVSLDDGGVITNGAKASTKATIAGVTLKGGGTLTNFGSVTGFGILGEGADRVVNWGYIGGIGGASVEFSSTAGRLVAEVGSTLERGAIGGNGILELAGGSETITGLGALVTITGGMTMSLDSFGTYQVDTPASVSFAGANTLAAAHRLIDDGGLSLAAGATLAIANGGIAEFKGAVANAGSMSLTATTSVSELVILSPGATLSGGGTIALSGARTRIFGQTATTSLTNIDNTISGIGDIGLGRLVLINQANGVIDAAGTGSLVVSTKGETLVNAGLIEASGGAVLILETTTVNNLGGAILAATGGKVNLEDDHVIGGSVGSAGTGYVYINDTGGELDGVAHAVTLSGQLKVLNGGKVEIVGAFDNTGKLELFAGASTTDLVVGAGGATLSGKGTVLLSNDASNRIYGLALTDTLTNVDNLIEGAGQLGNGVMTLVNQAGGRIIGDQSASLTINTVSRTITNAGLIENRGAGGTLVESAVVNTGTLLASTIGTLALTGAVTGAGAALVDGGTLDIVQAFAGNVTFLGTTGVFELGDSVAYTGKVRSLSTNGTNSLDLSDIVFKSGVTKATYSGTTTSGILTVTSGSKTAHISLTGDYFGGTFSVASDGHGGTTVIDSQTAPIAPLVQAMAGFQAAAPSGGAIAPASWTPAPELHAHT